MKIIKEYTSLLSAGWERNDQQERLNHNANGLKNKNDDREAMKITMLTFDHQCICSSSYSTSSLHFSGSYFSLSHQSISHDARMVDSTSPSVFLISFFVIQNLLHHCFYISQIEFSALLFILASVRLLMVMQRIIEFTFIFIDLSNNFETEPSITRNEFSYKLYKLDNKRI